MSAPVPDFIQIPAPVLLAEIPASHKILFGYIYWYTKLALQTCTASNETLGNLAGLDGGTVSNAIGNLKKLGFITVVYDGDPRSKKSKRTIDSAISYKKRVPRNNGTPQQGYVPRNNGTGATENRTKEEDIKRNRKELLKKAGDKSVDKGEDHRGTFSPAKQRLLEAIKKGEIKKLNKRRVD